MVNDCAKGCYAKNVFAGKRNFSLNKARKRFRSDFLAFFARISFFKFLEFKEFNKTIIPLALVEHETGYSQLGATRLVGYLPSHIQRALIE